MSDYIDTITQEKLDKLAENYDEWRTSMTSFEKTFCANTNSRYRMYGPMTQMSPKQRNILTEIVFKYDA